MKQSEANLLQKWTDRQYQSQMLHKVGEKATMHKYGIPINPINAQYQNSTRGQELAQKDEEKGLRRLVRAHYLQTMGSSGFNIVTGRGSIDVGSMVKPESQKAFEQKITDMYSRRLLNP